MFYLEYRYAHVSKSEMSVTAESVSESKKKIYELMILLKTTDTSSSPNIQISTIQFGGSKPSRRCG